MYNTIVENFFKLLNNAEFEKLTGIHVNYINYDSNEAMYAKLKSGGAIYDVIIPSDYMIQRLIDEDMLQKLNPELLNCMDVLSDAVKSPAYDVENEYSVSYFWGTVGIVYDKTKVSLEDLEKEGFGKLGSDCSPGGEDRS